MFRRYIIMLVCIFIRKGCKRADYLKKIRYFHKQGENCSFTIFNFGVEPHLLSFGNNVKVAAGVRFVCHDIIGNVIKDKYKLDKEYRRMGTIEVGDNVFIGANSIILYNVKIGNNVIIGAGSIINKDIPDNSIVAGNPARVVGKFSDYEKKLLDEAELYPWKDIKYSIYDKKFQQIQADYFWNKEKNK